ncbi:S8 family serine peptidase [Candidatus Pacearchaeota archaeon]|nr:S8 family serine peptidase [Candidatus Pacearchaeota archaeon]
MVKSKNKKVNYWLVLLAFGIILIFSYLINAELNKLEKVNEKVLKKFEEKEEIVIMVSLDDEKPLTENDRVMGIETKEEKKKKIREDLKKEFDVTYVAQTFSSVSIKVDKNDFEKLKQLDFVKEIRVEPEVKLFLQDSKGIVNATQTFGLQVSGINLTGNGETVCIIDSGINYSHNDFGACTRDQFLNGTCSKVLGGYAYYNNVTSNQNDVMGDSDHGTHVSGIVAANGSALGIAPEARIVMIKACDSTNACGPIAIVDGVNWCVGNSTVYNITVISMSLGTTDLFNGNCDSDWPELTTAVNNAAAKNISVIAATGNNGNATAISNPACITNSTPVGATDKNDAIGSYSNRNSITKLFAPGTSINSSSLSGNYISQTGTSMATPHVSAAFLTARQFLRLTGESKTPKQIEAILNNTGKRITDSSTGINYSRINIYDFIINMDNVLPNVTLISPTNNTASLIVNQTFRCNATDLSLKNLTFYLWNSTSDIINQSSKIISGGQYNFEINLTNLSFLDYRWNCLYYDENKNLAFANSNFTLIITSVTVNLISPSDGTKTNTNQTYQCNATSSSNLANATFYLWNSTNTEITKITNNVSGSSNSSSFNANFGLEGNYKWNCFFANTEGQGNFALSNFTIEYDLTKPTINITSPLNNSWNNIGNFNVTLNENGSCSYSLNRGINNISMNLSDNRNFFASNSTLIQDVAYNVTYYCNDSAGNLIVSDLIFFNIDKTQPNVSLISPDNEFSATGTTTIDFVYNVTDNLNITSCVLILNSASVAANSSAINTTGNSTNKISHSVSAGSYNWQINCTDQANNIGNSSSRSLTINVQTSSDGGGGGGSGAGDGGTTATTSQFYIITGSELFSGATKELRKNDKINFTIQEDYERNEEHILTLENISENSIVILIQSEIIKITLFVGQEIKVNLTSLEYYDLYLKLEKIENGKASITIKAIREKIIGEKMETDEKTIENGSSLIKDEVGDEDGKDGKTDIFITVGLTISFIIILIFVGILIHEFFDKKRSDKKKRKNAVREIMIKLKEKLL